MFQDERNVSFEELIRDIVPTSRFSKFKVEKMATEQLNEGKDFHFISDNILFTVSQGSIRSYFMPVATEPEVAVAMAIEEGLTEPVEKAAPVKKAASKKRKKK